MTKGTRWFSMIAMGLLGGCATLPSGPSVLVLPGHGKSLEQFQHDDAVCQGFARQRLGGLTPAQAMEESTVKTAATTALLGAAVGAAANGSRGAGVGAASGALLGTAAGSGIGSDSAWGVQRRYDHAYIQCMYAKGNQVPLPGGMGRTSSRDSAWSPSRGTPSSDIPSPPPGTPPPPPPGE